jgi:hypothetical protein
MAMFSAGTTEDTAAVGPTAGVDGRAFDTSMGTASFEAERLLRPPRGVLSLNLLGRLARTVRSCWAKSIFAADTIPDTTAEESDTTVKGSTEGMGGTTFGTSIGAAPVTDCTRPVTGLVVPRIPSMGEDLATSCTTGMGLLVLMMPTTVCTWRLRSAWPVTPPRALVTGGGCVGKVTYGGLVNHRSGRSSVEETLDRGDE